MRTTHRLRLVRGRWLAVTAAATVAAAGIAAAVQAAIPDSSGVIHGCYNASNGQLRVVSSGHACRRSEHAVSWNHTGPRGTAGPSGPAGATGVAGSMGATVTAGRAGCHRHDRSDRSGGGVRIVGRKRDGRCDRTGGCDDDRRVRRGRPVEQVHWE